MKKIARDVILLLLILAGCGPEPPTESPSSSTTSWSTTGDSSTTSDPLGDVIRDLCVVLQNCNELFMNQNKTDAECFAAVLDDHRDWAPACSAAMLEFHRCVGGLSCEQYENSESCRAESDAAWEPCAKP